MTDKVIPPEGDQAPIECGTFDSWDDAFAKIEQLIVSDQPEFIASVSEAEFQSGNWFASPINSAPPAILKKMLASLYPADKIRILLSEIIIEDEEGENRRVKQVVAVY